MFNGKEKNYKENQTLNEYSTLLVLRWHVESLACKNLVCNGKSLNNNMVIDVICVSLRSKFGVFFCSCIESIADQAGLTSRRIDPIDAAATLFFSVFNFYGIFLRY
ncbi:hypothetical protein CEXT_755811 [Caerostris extrusa]|uniref:Uncharacterized protein n=1 Tax=Caerostris extrusa TaxID=172846 RepID=A0AAV4T638_CAEEX|nr:hypothetical protein CEXT_755811 [Caerostris extrusa]